MEVRPVRVTRVRRSPGAAPLPRRLEARRRCVFVEEETAEGRAQVVENFTEAFFRKTDRRFRLRVLRRFR